jgi:hypothetical protein
MHDEGDDIFVSFNVVAGIIIAFQWETWAVGLLKSVGRIEGEVSAFRCIRYSSTHFSFA